MTVNELGKLTASIDLKKQAAAATAGILERTGGGILKLLKQIGGTSLYSAAAMPKSVTSAVTRSSNLAQELARMEAGGTSAAAKSIAGVKARLNKARAAADLARSQHRTNIGIVGAGLGVGTLGTLLSSKQQQPAYPYAYPPGYQSR